MRKENIKDKWIKKQIENIIVYANENIDRVKTGKNLRELREKLYVQRKIIKAIAYNYLIKLENGYGSHTRKILYKLLSEFYDLAAKIHDDIEENLWPIENEYWKENKNEDNCNK